MTAWRDLFADSLSPPVVETEAPILVTIAVPAFLHGTLIRVGQHLGENPEFLCGRLIRNYLLRCANSHRIHDQKLARDLLRRHASSAD